MSDSQVLAPDREFVDEILASGGGDLKKCYQCATCSVVCELAPDDRPFPRKEMVWAQWGLKDRLVADPDVWLCHQCNDCSLRCPRGARPGDVLAAVRRRAVRHYAVPKALATWINDIRMAPVMLLVAVGLLGGALVAREPIEDAFGLTAHEGFYAAFFPHWLLNTFFPFFTGLAFLVAVVSIVRFWEAMKRADAAAGVHEPVLGVLPSLFRTARAVLLHDRFGKCGVQASRRVAHLAAFYGFMALYVVTIWAVIDIYVNPALGIDSRYPFGLLHPMKVLANAGGVLLIYGGVKAIVDRRRAAPGTPASTSFDWVFASLLVGVGVTGFATEVFRFTVDTSAASTAVTIAYGVYFVHLVLVFQLLVYLPYSKFAHVLYRTVAMVYAEHMGRTTNGRRLPAAARVALHAKEAGGPKAVEAVATT